MGDKTPTEITFRNHVLGSSVSGTENYVKRVADPSTNRMRILGNIHSDGNVTSQPEQPSLWPPTVASKAGVDSPFPVISTLAMALKKYGLIYVLCGSDQGENQYIPPNYLHAVCQHTECILSVTPMATDPLLTPKTEAQVSDPHHI